MKNHYKLVLIIISTFIIGITIGFFLTNSTFRKESDYEVIDSSVDELSLPEDLLKMLGRFSLINNITSKTLQNFIILGGVEGSYEEGGEIFETFVISFEDRYEGAEADNDFLDVIVEFKRVKEEDMVTVRMVQLGLDTIDVYLDGEFIGIIRPGIEVRINK